MKSVSFFGASNLGTSKQGLIGATVAFSVGFSAVVLFVPLINYLGLTTIEKGLLLSIASLTGALLRIPFAAWGDISGGKIPILVLLCVALVGMSGISILLRFPKEIIIQHFELLLFLGALVGCGIATFPVGIVHTSYWFSHKEQGRVLAIYAGISGIVPGLFLFIISTFLVHMIEFANIYLLWTIFFMIGIIVYIFIGKNAWYFQLRKRGASKESAQQIAQDTYRQEFFPIATAWQSLFVSAKMWETWVLVFLYFCSFGGFLALTNWFPFFLQEYHLLSVGVAGTLTALYSIGAAIVRIPGGKLADRIGGRIVTTGFLLITLMGTLLLATNSNFILHIGGMLLLTIGMGVVHAGVFQMLPNLIPKAVGGAAGWTGGIGALGGFVFPNVLSRFLTSADASDKGFLSGFYTFAILTIISIVLVNCLPKPQSIAEQL